MRREDRRRSDDLERLVEREVLLDDELADPLEAEEACVSLVRMEDVRREPRGLQRAHATDAEHDLLSEPVLGSAAVETVGHAAFLFLILFHVGVEQDQRHATDLRLPELCGAGRSGEIDLDAQRRPVVAAKQGQRHRVRVESRVVLLLPSVRVQPLPEVALPVEKSDRDERDAEIARGLEVVAG